MNLLIPRRVGLGALAILLLATVASAETAAPGRNTVTIRSHKQKIHYYPATGARVNQKILFAPGDGGWHGWAITVAETMARWGYDVYGLDTKAYLDSFTGKTALTETDVMNDFREIAEWMTDRSGERVTLVGWSAGAALGVLGAAGDGNKKTFTGLVVFGLGDENVLAWHWWDNVISLVKKPNVPTFRVADYMAKVAPLPLLVIQSGHDEYVSLDEANRLFAVADEPKRFVLVQAHNHSFGGNRDGFYGTLREGVQWVSATPGRDYLASTVPAIEALTRALGLPSGMRAKSAGSSLLATNCQGPSVFHERNHRPDVSR